MASLQSRIDAVKAAVGSTSTCTPATVVTLKGLLLPDAEPAAAKAKSATRTTKTVATDSKPKSNGAARATAVKATVHSSPTEALSSRERTVLATYIINATLKSLTEAAKPPPPYTPSKPSSGDLQHPPSRRALRRSTSAPLSPLQPRTLNRVATSPIVATRTKATLPGHSTACLATVECARVAFAALRSVKGPVQADQTDFQLETGMSTLVGKLLALGLHELALKELRILKRRLDGVAAADANVTLSGIADLLDYHKIISKASLSTVTACQIQVLRLVAATKKPAHIESILAVLDESHISSPVNLLSKSAKGNDKERAKVARHLASLAQILLSIAPSISSKEDNVATEPRLSPSPSTAFQLQALAFRVQLRWWKLAGHKGNADDDILSPFSRCIKAFARRQSSSDNSTYTAISTAFDGIMDLFQSQQSQPTLANNSPLASIYHLLGSAAQTARQYDEAYRWFDKLGILLRQAGDSSVHSCSVSARLVASALKQSPLRPDIEQLTKAVTEILDGSLSATIAELNELLDSLSLTRRSIVGILMADMDTSTKTTISATLKDALQNFVLRYPRFLRRWLGAPPMTDAPTKQLLQFDQRRQLLSQSISQVMDATLVVVRCGIQSGSIGWQTMDDVLQDCSSLLITVSDPVSLPAKAEQLGGYRAKISSLYFSKFSLLRKERSRPKEIKKQMLQALDRSIESLKDCSPTEKEGAQLSTKLELFADLCRESGRPEDAVRTLRAVCTNMAECGVLSTVAEALSSQSPAMAWSLNDNASTLSRTLRSIAKLDKAWNDWTFFLPEAERAAVLEHLMHISSGKSVLSEPLRLHDPGSTALLRIYTTEKYPIRRFRVLLHLFYQNIGDEAELAEIAQQLDQSSQQLHRKDRGEDSSLAGYVAHLQAYHGSVTALAETSELFPVRTIGDAIVSWNSMIAPCQTKEDVHAVVDDPDGLLEYLQSANHLAGLRGECHLQLSILELSVAISRACAQGAEGLISGHSQLVAQYVNIGLLPQASKTLGQTKDLIQQYEGASLQALVDFHLSEAEYYTEIGSMDEALDSLSKANEICIGGNLSWAQSKSKATITMSMVSFFQSTLALQKGDIRDALGCIKSSVRMLSYEWSKLEAPSSVRTSSDATTSESSIVSVDLKAPSSQVIGPRFWGLAYPLIRCLLHISSVYAYIGMYQETLHYAETAWKVAETTQSSLYKARVSAWMGSVYLRAGNTDNALRTFSDAERWMPKETSSSRVKFARQLGEFYQEVDRHQKAVEFFQVAEDTAHLLSAHDQSQELPVAGDDNGTTQSVKETKPTRATRATRAKTPATTRAQKRGPVAKIGAPIFEVISSLPKDVYQASLLATIVFSKAVGLLQQRDWASALSALERVREVPKLLGTLSQEQVITAMSLIGHSMEQMIQDPVFSVIQDSTISFPAVAGPADRSSLDKTSLAASPPQKARGAVVSRKGAKDKGLPGFADALKQAQELLLEAHASSLSRSDSSTVYRISTLLQDTIILLSATASTKIRAGGQPGFATVAIDLARNLTWNRAQKALLSVSSAASTTEAKASHMSTPRIARRSSIGLTNDMTRFQKVYVEMIPKKWRVISMSLSDNRHDLCITKFQAGHSPFILRLPLERANGRDADSEVFNFEHGREELLDIIKLANETSHSAKDFTARGERTAWWAEREALDNRLGDLLATIEATWLGGFRGIFSQHQRRTDLLARFQKSFHQVLDSCLPSRNKIRGRKTSKSPTITLDPRILDLFIGLGDPSDPDCDFDEALNDLLYFVVDILQFQGERNAYDEIDFDAMVVETYDALRGYHSAAKADSDREDGAHTVLVLDKSLHAFPWESLPCMEGLAVSRVPSLACLQRLIADSKHMTQDDCTGEQQPEGHHVSAISGTCILNPSSDLKSTQAYFQRSFTSLESWTSIVKREPEETEFQKALSSSDIFVYFGHGSGAQYIRGKTVRQLEKCRPATFLMGCSSVALTEAGEFECYGPVWNYMMAGCPAVVGTLWDVTDRDIDRFAGSAFEEWGLFPKGTFKEEKKEKGKARSSEDDDMTDEDPDEGANASLPEAVARARSACRFKYLNGAAVVLYGIPVYLG